MICYARASPPIRPIGPLSRQALSRDADARRSSSLLIRRRTPLSVALRIAISSNASPDMADTLFVDSFVMLMFIGKHSVLDGWHGDEPAASLFDSD